MKKRVFLIVLDSMGIGELPDASLWHDEGSNTLGAIRNHPEFNCPNLKKMGFSISKALAAELTLRPQVLPA